MTHLQEIKKRDTKSKLLTILPRFMTYFPARFAIFGFIISYFLLYNDAALFTKIEEEILFNIIRFLNIAPTNFNGELFVGNIFSMHSINLPTKIQILFLVFFLTLAASSRTSAKIRGKILLFGGLCYLGFIAIQLLGILIIVDFNVEQNAIYHESIVLATTITSTLVLEVMLFNTLVLPKPTKVNPIIKRNYRTEYLFFALTILVSLLIYHFLLQILPIQGDSIFGVYAVINVLIMINLSNYIGYIIWEVRTPRWTKISKLVDKDNHKLKPTVTFLMTAYNEEEIIRKCIESIDRICSKYDGKTSIIVVDDGSTDNSAKIMAEALRNLKYSEGKYFTIPHAGKGRALNFGLKHTTDEIIFRIDSDSVMQENTIDRMVRHFQDPEVGCVGGMVFALNPNTIWQRIFNVSTALFSAFKRNGDLFDALIIQAGAFSVFRKDALMRAGGWAEDQNGEDGEITVRLGRLGYRLDFDDGVSLLSDAPANLNELRRQRARWAIAYYHSRSRNLNIVKELRGPRSLYFLYNLIGHGLGLISFTFWPFLIALVVSGGISGLFPSIWGDLNAKAVSLSFNSAVSHVIAIPLYLMMIEIITFSLHYCFAIYFLLKYKRLRSHILYVYLLRVWFSVISVFRLESLGILLSWSAKWKRHDQESYKDQLRAFSYSMNSWES
jgi:cellulose synthase/poly-beta-1,6-N-acetylglucosamine synthase-like glycosyltransferase